MLDDRGRLSHTAVHPRLQMAERDADGVGGGEEEEEDEAVKLATVTQAAAGTTNVTVIPVHVSIIFDSMCRRKQPVASKHFNALCAPAHTYVHVHFAGQGQRRQPTQQTFCH